MAKMKAVVKVKGEPNGTEMMSVDIPKPGPNDVLIKVDVASICGTDVHIFNWDSWASHRIKPPLLYGHEFAGHVVEVGKNVRTYLKTPSPLVGEGGGEGKSGFEMGSGSIKNGDYVSGECHIACGHCHQCKIGLAHVCQNMKVFGIDVPGVFAEYACIPATNVWQNDKDVPPDLCSIQDPLGNAVHSVYSTDVAGKDVVILGLGPIGIMCVLLCKHAGAANVFAVEKKNEYRSGLARKLGATKVFGEGETDALTKEIFELTKGKGADVILEMSGSTDALTHGFDLLRTGGDMILLGVYSQPATIDVSKQIIFKYTTVKGIYGRRMWGDWNKMKELFKNQGFRKDLQTIITHHFTFDKFFDAMETMRSGKSGKVVLSLRA